MSTKDRAERTKARPDDILELGLGFFFFPRRGVPGKKTDDDDWAVCLATILSAQLHTTSIPYHITVE